MRVFLPEPDERARRLAEEYGLRPYMVARYLRFLGRRETRELLEHLDDVRPALRTNTLLVTPEALRRQLEEKRGFRLERCPEPIDEGFWVVKEPPISLGATLEYMLGYYVPQDAASMVPPAVLNPRPGERVLDACAAPGGKTTHLAQLMGNEGTLIAIDVDPDRVRKLKSNLHRCHVANCLALRMNALDLPRTGWEFDRVLLDVPCTGEGVIHKDPSRRRSRDPEDIEHCARLQRRLLRAAAEVLKPGGVLVYSTCTFSPEENELNVQYAVEELGLEPEPVRVDWAAPGLRVPGVDREVREACARFYPHRHGTELFFVARLRKPLG
ncbi:MAG: RsmB/NOP family class I SAM-dependent RNA methyltransferase [Euryarchaeota archaeon]